MLLNKNQQHFDVLYIILLFVIILREPEGNNMFIGLRIFMRKQPT